MKKLYTLLSAAILSVGLVSAAPRAQKFDFSKLETPVAKEMSVAKAAPTAIDFSKMQIQKVSSSTTAAASRARISDPNATTVDPSGTYLLLYYNLDTEDFEVYNSFTISATSNSNEFLVKDFFSFLYSSFNCTTEFTATIGTTTYINEDGKTVVGNTLVIPGNGQLPVFTYGGYTYSLYLSDDSGFYNNDISFLISDEGALYWIYGDETALGAYLYVDDNWYGLELIGAPNAFPTFGHMTDTETYLDYDDNGNIIEVTEDASYPIYWYFADENYSKLVVMNFAASTFPVTVDINFANGSASVTDAHVYDYTEDGSTYIPCYAANDAYATTSFVVNGTTNITEDRNILINLESYYWMNPDLGALLYCENTIINLYEDEDNAGITNVIADDNSNAPVEYYNLQGVRVVNPEAGQLVIRRQGKNVSKIVVR
jgi:hypothetical protein